MLDERYRAEFARYVRDRYPSCPPAEAAAIAEHACSKYSGRVGRTAAAKEFAPEAIDLAVRAHVRHGHTRYDDLLGSGDEAVGLPGRRGAPAEAAVITA